ncbi:phosphonatase-like hydrolase [Mycolicibacterium pulveris]|uniref:Putative haloacid dehalogenase-like hydrolase n=1 Tax=Mycolicibacterium pulveris TaxID=36813 RepID=A0A7I7UHX0_MYCPV|nr:phosphonatase-like hydrolase [Mycolicibacterium pulveris]MCV6979639.1 phosphonatase-like hydrolase [Mycolicibacterium pulveris]BBY80915.1 putative haloacid dehalogenase-like hydrolase [Mycolicibacterium pulveris]
MQHRSIQLAVLDMAGTTVADDGLVLRAFDVAATAAGVPEDGPEREQARTYVLDTMGQSKIDVFRTLFGAEQRAQTANHAFEEAYARYVADGVLPIPGAAEAISKLREEGVKVVLTTGFSRSTQDQILEVLGWNDIADLSLCPADAGRGRPFPDLVLTAVLRTGIDDVAKVAVVGDTTSDILAGRRAGAAVVAGVLTGAHAEKDLRAAGATHVLHSVTELPELILSS